MRQTDLQLLNKSDQNPYANTSETVAEQKAEKLI